MEIQLSTLSRSPKSTAPSKIQDGFDIIERVDSFGLYQKVTIMFWALIIYFCGQLLFSVPFLFFQDPYQCQGLDPALNCQDLVCSLPSQERAKHLSSISINSLANELGDYRCADSRDDLDNLIAIMFFGIAVGYILLTLFGEEMGKKQLMLVNLGCYCGGIAIVLLFSGNWGFVAIGLLLAVMGISNCYIICFMFLVETVERTVREKATIFIQSFYGTGAVVNIFWFWLFQDWHSIFLYCYLIPSLILLAAIYYFLVDTPMSLILRNPPQFALEGILFIGRVNGRSDAVTHEDIQNVRRNYENKGSGSNTEKVTVLQLFKYRSTRWLLILLVLLQCTISFEFYAPSMMLGSFHFDIYANGVALASSQVIANFTGTVIVSKYLRKTLFFCCIGSTFLCSAFLALLWDQNGGQAGPLTEIIVLILLFCFQLAISMQYDVFYVFSNEVFPTQARVIAISFISLMGGLMSTFTAKVVGFCLGKGFPVMVVFMALSALCMLVVRQLPETYMTTPKDFIEELENRKAKQTTYLDDLQKNLLGP